MYTSPVFRPWSKLMLRRIAVFPPASPQVWLSSRRLLSAANMRKTCFPEGKVDLIVFNPLGSISAPSFHSVDGLWQAEIASAVISPTPPMAVMRRTSHDITSDSPGVGGCRLAHAKNVNLFGIER